jgi:hypothetical protein
MVDTTDIEKKSLEAHVELCAERYRALELQIDSVKAEISSVKTVMHEVHEMVHDMANQRNSQIINWGVGIIGLLTAMVGYLITHYVLK